MPEYVFKISVTKDGVLLEYPTIFNGTLAKDTKDKLALSFAALTSVFISQLNAQAQQDQNGFLKEAIAKLKAYEIKDGKDDKTI